MFTSDFGRGPVLRDVSLTVRQGETVCLMGPSGLGKPPCCGAWPGWSGRKAAPSPVFRRGLAMCSRRTGCAAFFPPWPTSAWQQAGLLPEPEILRHLEELGLAGSARRPVSQLSGGMRRRVAIARAVCAGPRLLLLDEAFKGLDDQCRRDTVAYIRRHTPGASLLCVTHDPEEAALLGAAVWTCPPYDCDMEPKNVSHSETFR
ncbi:MAG: ATP-binding cassette domain-containing protein [Oscillospiraceae bacterium]